VASLQRSFSPSSKHTKMEDRFKPSDSLSRALEHHFKSREKRILFHAQTPKQDFLYIAPFEGILWLKTRLLRRDHLFRQITNTNKSFEKRTFIPAARIDFLLQDLKYFRAPSQEIQSSPTPPGRNFSQTPHYHLSFPSISPPAERGRHVFVAAPSRNERMRSFKGNRRKKKKQKRKSRNR